ncbi:class I SAM-dependent methyltransferase [Actinoplanes sp. KI2]|uniref:class I SAM-dependent methyltransferase n=1 Tax=Actinoplanes sp. KI2 TaxID=2983315 RepID=UPI0021D5855B|nr:class I SAM-dependent methyltransferase [Actinoplanes sp. KI2]MCU7728993.1 class I SAM-dependent methyltransferase [Actinoplanes sp. KI2]
MDTTDTIDGYATAWQGGVVAEKDALPDWQPLTAELAKRSLAADDPTGWFEPLYAAGRSGSVKMPWERRAASPPLVDALAQMKAEGRTAVVVGCGLGQDAEEVARRGFRTTAFDVSPSAVQIARERRPESAVTYVVADLLDLPAGWRHAFDLVVEIITVQALPPARQPEAAAAVAGLLAPGGDLLVISSARLEPDPIPLQQGPPWPLSRNEVQAFAVAGVRATRVDLVPTPSGSAWLARFTRTAAHT